MSDNDVHRRARAAVGTVSLALALVDGARALVDVVVACHNI